MMPIDARIVAIATQGSQVKTIPADGVVRIPLCVG